MGDRANVFVVEDEGNNKEEGVYLYTHWGGSELPKTVARALDRGRERWGDTPYLTRIIFSEMIKREVEGLTGYGISTKQIYGDDDRIITIYPERKELYILSSGRYYSFEEFIRAQPDWSSELGEDGRDNKIKINKKEN